jgi:CheY-like chemotaxis protein
VSTHLPLALVVDDDPDLVGIVMRALSGAFRVEQAVSGLEAVARVRAGERFDVVLTDLMMPRMSGAELHAAVAAVDPEQAGRFVFMSGAMTARTGPLAMTARPILEKPFSIRDLRRVMGSVVSGVTPQPS